MKGKGITMQRALLLAASLTAVLLSPALAQESAWQKVKESDGITVFMRKIEGSSIYEAKSVGMINAPLAATEAVLRDAHAMEDYAINCREAAIIDLPGYEKSKDIIYGYVRMDMPWPVMDRDTVAQIKFSVDPKTGTLYALGNAVKSDYKRSPDVIRTPVNTLKYTLVPKGADRTEATIQAMVDPGGSIPPSLVNFFSRHGSIWSFNTLRKTAAMEKYRRDGPILTTTPATAGD